MAQDLINIVIYGEKMTEDGKCESMTEFIEHILTLPNSDLMREAFNNKTTVLVKETLYNYFNITDFNDPMTKILTDLKYPGKI